MANNPNIDINRVQNPLSQEDINQLKDTLQSIPIIRAALKDAQRAGVDTSKQLEDLDAQERQINQILSVYDKS